ncbi:ABC transporter permease [Cohnella sp. CIP 111063]|jgi:ABC-type sugar transport system, permease component|uniref:carbohydrate ABC transporter permease n=1 Tax=unclassified Cohnella TaxID=2636738 RepID=UPI000B8BD2CE|nr:MULTISPECIES: carbohydrate ABC transporter permease [unclassified Cohnella]OXS58024.1 ABC transporter permease [Cohnella sp. CIP 111063]PRX71359.1 putative aldouronate transport system permease protein [Cohnella sp. SGD-V74]
MQIRRSLGEKIFDAANVIILALACVTVIIPILHVIASSLSSTNALIHAKVSIWPVDFNWSNYEAVMKNKTFWRSFSISIFVVVVGTLINMLMTIFTAYPLSKSYLRGKNAILIYIVFTMIFYPPMIPVYLVVKDIGLINTVWAMIIPVALSQFNLLICLTFFRSLPEELFEAARVDGMGEMRMVMQIAVPLSKPIMMTLGLFYAVFHWNSYATALLYITKTHLKPLQLYLYNLVAKSDMNDMLAIAAESTTQLNPQGLQMATIMVATVPIVIIYPFIQKHFIKGALIGSVKE